MRPHRDACVGAGEGWVAGRQRRSSTASFQGVVNVERERDALGIGMEHHVPGATATFLGPAHPARTACPSRARHNGQAPTAGWLSPLAGARGEAPPCTFMRMAC